LDIDFNQATGKNNMKLVLYILIVLNVFFVSCSLGNQESTSIKTETAIATTDSVRDKYVSQKESTATEDLPANEYMAEQLKHIRANFRKINSISDWSTVETKELWESTEGGGARFYTNNGALQKVLVRQFGETFQKLTEYYLLDGKLSLVIEKVHQYNRPIYYDSSAMRANGDDEAFDFTKAEIIEDRSYFQNGKLLHQLSNQDCGAPFADEYLQQEQKRILTNFQNVIALVN
jgi:hypothetical protein